MRRVVVSAFRPAGRGSLASRRILTRESHGTAAGGRLRDAGFARMFRFIMPAPGFRLKFLPALLVGAWLSVAVAGRAQVVSTTDSAPYNNLILQEIRSMPQAGGYSANHAATQRLGSAVSLNGVDGGLNVEAARAQPSYCSGATYLVFLKTIDALAKRGTVRADGRALDALLINGQRDGEGVWGRWNANGPGTARLFYEMRLGQNFSDFAQAQPGDFMKIFWSNAVGRREHGHSVIFLGTETVKGVESVRFWSSNVGYGYSEKVVPRTKIAAAVFSRLTSPQNLEHAPDVTPRVDPYLAGLLTKDSNLAEVRAACGM